MAVSRIIKMELSDSELAEVRSMLSDRTITDVYCRTEGYDGEPAALVDRRRLGVALDRIGHEGSSVFRDRLAGALEVTR